MPGKPHDPKPTQQPQDPTKPGPGSPTAENLGAATPQTEDSTKKEQERKEKEGEDSAEDSEPLPQQFGGAVLGGLSLIQLLRLAIQVIDLVQRKAPQAQSAQGGGAATQQRDLDQLDRAKQAAEQMLQQHQP